MTNATIALLICVVVVCMAFCLCVFAMSAYALIMVSRLAERKSYQEILTEFEKVVNERIQVVTSDTLEPGVYIPRKEPITGETTYQKASEESEIQKWLSSPSSADDDHFLQELMGVTHGA